MSKSFHMCINVRDQICRTDKNLKAIWKSSLKVDGRTLETGNEIKNFFMNELAKGHEVIPGGKCDNFDYKKGCQGHKEVAV